MLRQYLEIKSNHPDAILMFRLGDFYEMFFEDAKVASDILGITLTSRNKNDKNPVPLCGVPYHSVEPYVATLLENGKKVAICEQVEDPAKAKGVVKREVTRVITPGVITDGLGLDAKDANYLVSTALVDGIYGFALIEASTGLFRVAEFASWTELMLEILRIEPREILVDEGPDTSSMPLDDLQKRMPEILVTHVAPARDSLDRVSSLDGGGAVCSGMPSAAAAAEMALCYLERTQMGLPGQITRVEPLSDGGLMRLDEQTRRNLELVATMREGSREGSLIWALDFTRTAAGARLLKRWILYPLTDPARIDERLCAVEALASDPALIFGVQGALARIYDIERIAGRAAVGRASPRDLSALAESLSAVFDLAGIAGRAGGALAGIAGRLEAMPDLCDRIGKTLVEEPPLSARDGGIIRDGVSAELDELRLIVRDAKGYIARMEAAERESSGIGSLKIRYNRVFGYYIEITNAHKDRAPLHYIRRQTLAGAERYITPQLKELEERVLGGNQRAQEIEQEIFARLREEIAGRAAAIQATAQAAAEIDVLASFAQVAGEYDYRRPVVDSSSVIEIREGRHPIVERLGSERFVPNDVEIDAGGRKLLLITGPNMAGKSTVMRQTALITLMAQIGSFVPAREARIGVADRIFTRVGAHDALAQGRSTFMVEMAEASVILREAGPQSLVIIDEMGRGTSTFDGLAIAWAAAEDLHDRVGARTMFATHYHELTELAKTKPGISNLHVAVKEWNGRVIFLRRLVSGATPHSYGIQVAALAGLPDSVISRAREVLVNLEAGEYDEAGRPRIGGTKGQGSSAAPSQGLLFCEGAERRESEIESRLSCLKLDSITPIEAMNILHELAGKL